MEAVGKSSKFNIYQFDAQLAKAFQTDCEEFLHEFKEHRHFGFQVFAELWRQKCFLAIFKGLDNILTMQAFLENCFLITKKFTFCNDLYVQTGAVYILYSLYYKQPIKEFVKIRLNQSDVEKINEILEIHKRNKMLDPVFIYSKMQIDGAFQYCALSQVCSLGAKSLKRFDLSSEEINVKSAKDSVLNKFKNMLENDADLKKLQDIDDEYQRLAQEFNDKNRKLFVFPSKINLELRKIYSGTLDNDESVVKRTKSKAMANTNATYRGERKVVTATDLQFASTSKD